MTKAGMIVLVLTGAVAGASLVGWLAGLLMGVSGGLIHLLLLLALVVGPAGIVVGVVLLLVGRRRGGPR